MGSDTSLSIGMLPGSVSRSNGGVFVAVQCLSRALHDLPGTNIRVFGLEDQYTYADLASWGSLAVSVFPIHGLRVFGYAPGLPAALSAADLDLLHVHSIWQYCSIASLQWAAHYKRPYLISPHGTLDIWALKISRWKKILASWIYENAHLSSAACLHALCEAEALAIRAYGLHNPICVIPNGIDLPPEESSPSEPPWQKSVPVGAKVLFYLGRLHPKKGLPNLLRGWHLVRQQIAQANNWYLVIAGWDQVNHESELKALSQQLGVNDSVRFVGPHFNAAKHASYRAADAFILPSFSEGLPMVVLEAWAYGLPVLMTPGCNLPEGFQAGAALKIHTNPDDIARGLHEFFVMPDHERQAMGERGRRLVEQRFSWPKIAEEMRTVYDWVLGGGQRPAWVVT